MKQNVSSDVRKDSPIADGDLSPGGLLRGKKDRNHDRRKS